MTDAQQIAMLIDTTSTRPAKMDAVVAALAKRGSVAVRRAFGSGSKAPRGWKAAATRLGITQEPSDGETAVSGYAVGIALTLAALDLLQSDETCDTSGTSDTYAIVSGDGDFSPLVRRLQRAGKSVIGIGKRTSPKAFRRSCDEFLTLTALDRALGKPAKEPKAPRTPRTPKEPPLPPELRALAEAQGDTEGYVPTELAGKHLRKLYPAFRLKPHGAATLALFCKNNSDLYELKRQREGKRVVSYYRCLTPTVAEEPAPLTLTPSISPEEVHELLRSAAAEYADREGYVLLNRASAFIRLTHPDFKVQFYGHAKLSQLIKAHPTRYELRETRRNDTAIMSYKCL